MSNTYSVSFQKYSFQVEIHMSITSDTKNYLYHLNPLKFLFSLQYLFERRPFNSLTYTGMPVYPGVYRHMVILTLYRHAALCGVIRYEIEELKSIVLYMTERIECAIDSIDRRW